MPLLFFKDGIGIRLPKKGDMLLKTKKPKKKYLDMSKNGKHEKWKTISLLTAAQNNTRWNDKIVVLWKATLQLYFKTFILKINSANLIM